MTIERQLSQTITDRLDHVTPPQPDLDAVVRRGRRRQRRRHIGVALASTVVLGAGLATAAGMGAFESGSVGPRPERLDAVGQLDFTDGLRAYMSPDADGKIWLGGRSFPVGDLSQIDTDATATPYGMVFFDRAQRAYLMREDGTSVPLAPAPDAPRRAFHPTSKSDSRLPLVAWSEPAADRVIIRLYDLAAGAAMDSIEIPCAGAACSKVFVDAVDQGLVFVRTAEGTSVWDPNSTGDARWTTLSGPGTQVADARNKRILHTGRAPTPAAGSPIDSSWSFTEGAIDAQLSFDGRYVLDWSTRLEPTSPAHDPVELDISAGDWPFVTFDTDGSVLVAVPDAPLQAMTATVYDCEIPSGVCTELSDVKTESGDPVFVGNDM
ncbi:MAG: hypothetical protein ACRDO1_04035 [Nocardioidaceae bacterium]